MLQLSNRSRTKQRRSRACRTQDIKGPGTITHGELNVERKVCSKKLKELQQQAPYLCVCHLQQRRITALAKGDNENTKALLEMIKKGEEKKTIMENTQCGWQEVWAERTLSESTHNRQERE